MENSLMTPSSIVVEAGNTFCVKIHAVSEESTGYHFELVWDLPNNIEFLSKEWIPDNSSIGSSGTAVFRFKAIYADSVTHKLVFVQLAPDSTIADSIAVSVQVIRRICGC